MGDGNGSGVYGRMSVCVRCYEMMCCEFEEVWSTSAALERVPVPVKKMPPTDEHVVDEQRAGDERFGDASSVSSERT